jgi:hypothetical protein
MKLLSPVNYRSEQPSANSANNMLDMVSNSPLYISISQELKTVLLQRSQDKTIDDWEWRNLMDEFLLLKKRYEQYSFSFACFEASLFEVMNNSMIQKSWKWIIQYWDNIKKPWVLTFTNSDQLAEFLVWIPWFDEMYNESIPLLLQTTRSASAQLLFEITKDEQKNTYIYEYRVFILIDRSIQYKQPVVQHIFSNTVSDLQTLYALFMKFLPDWVKINEGLHRVLRNKLIQKEQFDNRANDDEQYEYAQLFDEKLWVLLEAYRDRSVSQENKDELFERVCQNEWWCFFIENTNSVFTFSTLESIIKNRPHDTFRLFAPDVDAQKRTITFEWQQINNEMKEMINLLNNFLEYKILWKKINKLSYKTYCLVIAWEIIDDETIAIYMTFWWPELKKNSHYHCSYQKFSVTEFYQLLRAFNYYFLDRDTTINPFYLGKELEGEDQQNNEWFDNEDDDYKY